VLKKAARGSWFDKLTMSGIQNPLVLSLSKDEERVLQQPANHRSG
jgi:hypothetical protein